MLKKLFFALVVVALVVGAIVYAKLGQFTAMGEAAANMALPPETVTALTVSGEQWEQVIATTATVSAVQGVTVSAEVGGRVSRIAFESGAVVAAGDVLLQLDTASEDAQLASAEAAAALAQADLARVRKLGKRDLASDDTVDRAEAQVKETVAQVGVIRALIAKKSVRAPFAGRLGLRLVNLGQILSEGDPIVALHTLDPVHVDFSIPQRQLARLRDGMAVRVTTDAAPGETFHGEIVAVSPEVDAATRNVRVRALVANPGERLHTGMFANIEVVLPDMQRVLPVPATAVLYATFGDSVFVVEQQKNEKSGEAEQVLRQQFVRLGQARGDFVDVTDGLKDGETVVTSGVFKLRSGIQVVIDNALAPKASLEPRPGDS
ncbi:MAG: efflux RND transporter periplasmic adaptor subunit [Gammaproteobacteria bacterium]|nr:efflux RND transporter periplasmic adaptor subunit [Gammaproteobacteria bacterium]MCB1817075.1 efflux RND transporter periplasmic adaptor subunit [Gammaproteobacteria bacterium]MCP5316509.1 efflux RND transporter periplasmic adaptor subunit [Chromatiaceae bacterium]MCP5434184.1 efflux RND transporter periplasmic adaptor subunit [Chromatiaceae bacterium]HOP15537.1 efflux RND transporter periplasmic adaptor subunit [Gammaproteobacteria bacterium]